MRARREAGGGQSKAAGREYFPPPPNSATLSFYTVGPFIQGAELVLHRWVNIIIQLHTGWEGDKLLPSKSMANLKQKGILRGAASAEGSRQLSGVKTTYEGNSLWDQAH